MKRIFLSLGFSARPERIVREEIEKAIEAIKAERPHEELEFIHNYDYNGENNIECLGEAIKKLSTCHEAYFINGWYTHRGCLIENKICLMYNIPHYTISV